MNTGKEGGETRNAAPRRTDSNAATQHERHRKTRAQIGKTRAHRTLPFLTTMLLYHQIYLKASCENPKMKKLRSTNQLIFKSFPYKERTNRELP
jgi:hypothetical protein